MDVNLFMYNSVQRMDELYHYGKKGQKWGVRNGPPYPLNRKSSGSNRSNSKENKSNTRSKSIQESIKTGKIRVNNLPDYNVGDLTKFTNSGKEYVSGLVHGHDFDWQEMEYTSVFGLKTPVQLLKLAPDAYDSYKKEDIEHGTISDSALSNCNPGYGKPGTTQNCAKCSAVLELSNRGENGYNFTAGRQTYPSSVDAMSHWFKGAERMHMDTDITEDSIRSFGKKTSGTISIQYPDEIGGGHSMHWTVDDKGSFEIQDGQNGKRFSSVSSMLKEYGGDSNKGLDIFRLDNCEPNWDNIEADSVIRGNSVKNKFSGRVVDTW